MKGSRKFVIIGLLLIALFFGGAILGSFIANAMMYLIIGVVAVAAALLIVFGYTGVKKEDDDE